MAHVEIQGPNGPEQVHLLREEDPHTADEAWRTRPPAENMARWDAEAEDALEKSRAARQRKEPSILWIVALLYAGLLIIQLTCDWPL
jgi:hypothetical protein